MASRKFPTAQISCLRFRESCLHLISAALKQPAWRAGEANEKDMWAIVELLIAFLMHPAPSLADLVRSPRACPLCSCSC